MHIKDRQRKITGYLKNVSKPRFTMVTAVLVAFIFLSGCTFKNSAVNKPVKSNSKKFIAAVSILPEKGFVNEVSGGLVDVVSLVPSGKSLETYEPSPKTIELLSKADVYFSIGVPSENTGILTKIKNINPNIKIVSLADEVDKVYPALYFENEKNGEITSSKGIKDPHIWTSPKRVKIMVQTIADELSAMDPDNKATYSKNSKSYIKKLDFLDDDIEGYFKQVQSKTFVIYHPELGYFANDYGLNMLSIEQEGKESTISHLKNLIDTAKNKGIKAIFCQLEFSSKQAKVVASDIGATVQQITVLSTEDYIGNLKSIALQIRESLK